MTVACISTPDEMSDNMVNEEQKNRSFTVN